MILMSFILWNRYNKFVRMSTHQELEQELLAFEHLASLPESIEDITFKVQLLSLTCEFQKQLYVNYRQRREINQDKNNNNIRIMLKQLKLPKPIDSQKWRQKILFNRKVRTQKLYGQFEQLKDTIVFDKAEEEKAVSQMGKIEKEILQCVAFELEAFKKIKDKEGKPFKYYEVTEEELRKVAEKRFGKALEAVCFVLQKNKEATA